MLKKILICGAVIILGKAAIEMSSVKNTDKNITKILKDINEKLPQTVGNMRMEKVDYVNHVIRYSGTVLGGQGLTEEMKDDFQKQFKVLYCETKAFKKANIGVDYSARSLIMKGINDKLSDETWVASFRPEHCI
ncbi:MAG: hypothetical protein M3R45_14685 [Pseudomonadota bacterium]|nr:hypothetical protein [Pseudomonadota bacterium]